MKRQEEKGKPSASGGCLHREESLYMLSEQCVYIRAENGEERVHALRGGGEGDDEAGAAE
jgi:hypothetical protein